MSGCSDTLAVIIGRAGSKGLPGKNAALLAGRPLVCHTIDDALEAASVGRVLVSTDCPQVRRAALGMDVPVIDRPTELASDQATVDAAVRHAVRQTGASEPIIVILYANVPVRPDDLIDRAVDLLRRSNADSVQSYADVGKHHPHWMVRLDESGTVEPYHPSRVYRRQELPPLYLPDGGVIAVGAASLFTVQPGEPHAFLGRDRRGIVSPRGSVIDVDEPIDLVVADALLRRCVVGSAL